MKTECPRCKTTDNAPYSQKAQNWRCVCCGHDYIMPPGPPPIPISDSYRVCENCCNLSIPQEKQHEITVAFCSLIILVFFGTCGWFFIGIYGFLIALIFFVLYVVAWIIKKPHVCTSCGTPNMIALTSPKGVELIEKYNLKTWTEPDC
jgi:hypothetical protein